MKKKKKKDEEESLGQQRRRKGVAIRICFFFFFFFFLFFCFFFFNISTPIHAKFCIYPCLSGTMMGLAQLRSKDPAKSPQVFFN
jgi:hypothetical protein